MPARIAIVEDEFLIALEMEEVVRDLGHFPVGVADTAEGALDMARSEERIDVALVDVNLADGATGPTVGRRLASEFGIEVVFVTANPAQLGPGVEGTIGALEKPVGMAELSATLDYVLSRAEGRAVTPPPVLRLFAGSQDA